MKKNYYVPTKKRHPAFNMGVFIIVTIIHRSSNVIATLNNNPARPTLFITKSAYSCPDNQDDHQKQISTTS